MSNRAPVIIPSATPDLSFNGDGRQATDFASTNDTARAVATMADGRFVVAGNAGDDFAVARYLANGDLDRSFSGDGKVTTDVPGVGEALAVAVQSDGKVVVVGSSDDGTNLVILRYAVNGDLDTSFNGTGRIETGLVARETRMENYASVLIQPDGAIVVAGSSHSDDRTYLIQRYTSAGILDTSFSGDGSETGNFRTRGDYSEIFAMVQQVDGKILVAGLVWQGGYNDDFAVARYNANGTLDTTFNTTGKLVFSNGSDDERINDIQVQADGKIVLVGNRGSDGFIARLNANGTLDSSFHGDGIAIFDNGSKTDAFNSLNIQADGKYLVSGRSGNDGLVVRFNATDGSLDTGFNSTGFVTTKIGNQNSQILDAALMPDGKLLVVGNGSYDFDSKTWDFALMKLGAALPVQKIMAYTGTSRPDDSPPDSLSYQIPAQIFHDPDGDTLSYSVTQGNGSALPSWMTFNASTRTISGSPTASDFGVYSLKVTASDGKGGNVSANLDVQVKTDFIDGVLAADGSRLNSSSPEGTPVTITYSFMVSHSEQTNAKERDTFQAMTDDQKVAVRKVLELYASVSGITFQEVDETTGAKGTIQYGTYRDDASSTSGYARGNSSSSDIWMNRGYFDKHPSNVPEGSRPFNTLIHETGHALGLKHPGIDPGDEAPFVDLDYGLTDVRTNSIMSYVYRTDATINSSTGEKIHPSTPMRWDVASIQYLYGANPNYNAGDTTYTFDPATPFFKNIWDGGGNDTINISNYTFDSIISLVPGTLSSLHTAASAPSSTSRYWGKDNLSISYNTVIENAIGGSGNDTLIGNDVRNVLDGGAGNDTMIGGKGNDIYHVRDTGDVIIETSTGGTDAVYSHLAAYTLGTNIENGRIMNTTASSLTGNARNNYLVGNNGNDTLDGGAGNDTMVGGNGNDVYHVRSAGDVIIETSTGGTDAAYSHLAAYTLGSNIENGRIMNTTASSLTGNARNNYLVGNNGNDTLDGGAGNDTLVGGNGNDVYHVRSAGDVIIETSTGGTDAAYSHLAAYTLGSNIENGRIMNTTASSLTGNSLNNYLVGNNGNDTLNGGAGNDTMVGGAGDDMFVFSTPLASNNIDTIIDFTSGRDKIVLDDDIFTALGITGTTTGVALTASKFQLGTAANDSGDRIVYDQSSGKLYYDADGTGTTAAIQFATLSNKPGLVAADFLVVA